MSYSLRPLAWVAERVSSRLYPSHGTYEVMGGRLTGRSDTDYHHFNCPRCGPSREELDKELLGVRNDGTATDPAYVVMIGVHCHRCGLTDLLKIGCLGKHGDQPRRVAEAEPLEPWREDTCDELS